MFNREALGVWPGKHKTTAFLPVAEEPAEAGEKDLLSQRIR